MKTVILSALFFLLIFPISNTFADELTLNIDKSIYEKSDFISVWGTSSFDSVFISIKDPDGNNVWNESLKSNEENKFSTLIIAGIGGWNTSGNYLVIAESGSAVANEKFFYDSGAQVNPPSAVSDYYVSPVSYTHLTLPTIYSV